MYPDCDMLRRAAAATRARFADAVRRARPAGPAALSPQDLGRLAELGVACRFGGAVWPALPLAHRRAINGGGRAAPGDRGVDAVGPDGALIQVKWYDAATVGTDAFARLNNVAAACGRAHGLADDPPRVLVVRAGAAVARGAVGADVVDVVALTDDDIGVGAAAFGPPGGAPAGPELADGLELAAADAEPVAARFDALHDWVVARVVSLAAAGYALVRTQMPVGSGKSCVIARLACRHLGGRHPVVVVAPRVEIVKELAALFAGMLRGVRVTAVADGAPWPDGAGGDDVIVVTGQSVAKAAKPGGAARPAAALFVDESHHRAGHCALLGAVAAPVRYDFSACAAAGGAPDVAVAHADAVAAGLICAAEFVFAVFARAPTFGDLAAHLAAHPEHAAVLACAQTVKSAREFADACVRRIGPGAAATFVGDDDAAAFDAFKRGGLRVLCVVGRVEMGVNIHRCDTVMFVEPWASDARNLQLIGRGVRLHPTKNGFFTVLVGAGPDDVVDRRVARYVELLHASADAFAPRTLADVENCVDVVAGVGVAGAAAAVALAVDNDAIEAVRREIFDAVGRRIADPAYAVQLQYRRACRLVAGAGLQTADAYTVWRCSAAAAADVADLPEDPTVAFAALPDGFAWPEFLGITNASSRDALTHTLQQAVDELYEQGVLRPSDIAAPNSALYARLRAETKSGARLPENPFARGETWATLFAGVE